MNARTQDTAFLNVPFVDLQAQYRQIKREVDEAVGRVIENAAFVLGREVETFEEAFAEYVGARYCVGVSNGTIAIQLALQACGVTCGDEVIVPTNSFFATAEAVSTAGARPRFVDCTPDASTIDVTQIEAAINERTRAIMPVHLYGQAADLDPIFEIARRHNLLVIEDAAQAHGSLYKGKRVGALGDAGCFSFYPGKNLGAYGEGGAVVTNDGAVAKRLRMLRDHGSTEKYKHEFVGYNARLEGLQGAVLNVKLKHLDVWNDLRRAHAARYVEMLNTISQSASQNAGENKNHIMLPREMDYARHIYHLFVIELDERERVQEQLKRAGVQTGIHYPVPIHLQPAYVSYGHKPGDFPVAEAQAARVLSLPMFPELSEAQLAHVAQSLIAATASSESRHAREQTFSHA